MGPCPWVGATCGLLRLPLSPAAAPHSIGARASLEVSPPEAKPPEGPRHFLAPGATFLGDYVARDLNIARNQTPSAKPTRKFRHALCDTDGRTDGRTDAWVDENDECDKHNALFFTQTKTTGGTEPPKRVERQQSSGRQLGTVQCTLGVRLRRTPAFGRMGAASAPASSDPLAFAGGEKGAFLRSGEPWSDPWPGCPPEYMSPRVAPKRRVLNVPKGPPHGADAKGTWPKGHFCAYPYPI